METNRLAIIDLDGTLLKGTTAERTFLFFLLKRGRVSIIKMLSFLISFYKDVLVKGFRGAIGTNASFLSGRSFSDVKIWAREFGRFYLDSAVPDQLQARISRLKEDGCLIVILSGSLQILVDQLKQTIPADLLIGGTLEVADGKLTGNKTGIYPFGRGKVEALFKKISTQDVDWQNSWAFADRFHDLPVLELVGNPVAVNPDRRLLHYAQNRNWEIIR